jgi:hypothetical protein
VKEDVRPDTEVLKKYKNYYLRITMVPRLRASPRHGGANYLSSDGDK